MPGEKPKSGGGHRPKITGHMTKTPPIKGVKPMDAAPDRYVGKMRSKNGDTTPFNPRARGSRLP